MHIELEMSPEVHDALEGIARDSGESMADIFRNALSLFMVTYIAQADGDYVGIVSNPDILDTRFTGIL